MPELAHAPDRQAAARWNRPLLVAAALMVPALALCLTGLAFDDRQLVGAPIWLKPFKFAVSILIYAGTWAWLVPLLPQTPQVRRAATTVAAVLVLEQVLIIGQVLRGHQSNFNYTTALDAAVVIMMGTSITVLATMNIVLALALLRQRFADPAVAVALRYGSILSLVGILSGVLMVVPRPHQLDAAINGDAADRILGAHSVGAADGGPTMALTGWSTTTGDLRVPHFVGIHALQVLPLVALALALLAAVMPSLRVVERRARLVRAAGRGCAGLFVISLWQAMRGQSVAHPDLLTWSALGGLALAVAAAAGLSFPATDESEGR